MKANESRRARGSGRIGLLRRHGLRPWMIVMVMALGLGFAAVLYWVDRGHGLTIPAPRSLDLPAAR